jgi:hypothetical protein
LSGDAGGSEILAVSNGMYQGRNFGCNFGAIAISASVQVRGHLLVKQAVNSPQKHILRMFKIDLVAADLSIELLGVEFIV